jgi:hypothetical protein
LRVLRITSWTCTGTLWVIQPFYRWYQYVEDRDPGA